MARTIGDCITNVRVLLQDAIAPYRNTDEELYAIFNNAMSEVRRLRPDLFLTALRTPMTTYTTASATLAFPIDEQFYRAVLDYCVSEAETRNDEFTTDSRAASLLQMFHQRLTTMAV
jgi:hypothetical protein